MSIIHFQSTGDVNAICQFQAARRALSNRQKEDLIHRTTDLLVSYLSEAARPHTMVLEIKYLMMLPAKLGAHIDL